MGCQKREKYPGPASRLDSLPQPTILRIISVLVVHLDSTKEQLWDPFRSSRLTAPDCAGGDFAFECRWFGMGVSFPKTELVARRRNMKYSVPDSIQVLHRVLCLLNSYFRPSVVKLHQYLLHANGPGD